MDDTLPCSRCGAEVRIGRAEFYVVNIEAYADPNLTLTAEDLQRDLESERRQLIDEVRKLSEQEAMDQVYRRLTLYFCNRCYTEWIEHPAG